jgi:hypothetical protein
MATRKHAKPAIIKNLPFFAELVDFSNGVVGHYSAR